MFVRLHKGALQVRLPVVERTWASKPRWVGIWRVGIVESDELLNFDRLQKLAARRFARVPELRISQGDVFISVWDSGAVHVHHREVEAQEAKRACPCRTQIATRIWELFSLKDGSGGEPSRLQAFGRLTRTAARHEIHDNEAASPLWH